MKLGDSLRHRVNGFSGIAIGRAEYLTGCTQWLVLAREVKEDGESRSAWIDEVYLERDGNNRLELEPAAVDEKPGGPLTHKAPPK